MKKIFLLSVAIGSYMFADNQSEVKNLSLQSNTNEYNWVIDSSDDSFTADARSRRGKGQRGRRRGGGGLR